MIKQIGIVLVILIIVLWGFGKLMDSAMADVTGAGTTTNDQVNSSGSNTAITGGYHLVHQLLLYQVCHKTFVQLEYQVVFKSLD